MSRDARASKVTAPAAEPGHARWQQPAPPYGVCLLLVSWVVAVWLGHRLPYPPAPGMLGEAVAMAAARPEAVGLWCLIPFLGTAYRRRAVVRTGVRGQVRRRVGLTGATTHVQRRRRPWT